MFRSLAAAGLATVTGLLAAPAGAAAGAAMPHEAGVTRDLGPAPSSQRIELVVSPRYRREAELARLVELEATPASPLYRHFLTPVQFAAAFGPAGADYERTVALLRERGFHIERTSRNRTVIDVSAPASTVERYFSTVLRSVDAPGVGETTVPVREPVVPAELARTVDAVDGFDGTEVAHPLAHARPGLPLESRWTDVGPIKHAGALGPNATSVGYDLPVVHGTDGTGRATGNVICGDFRDGDLTTFLGYFQITRTGPATTRVPVDGGAKYYPPSRDRHACSFESSLDAQTIVGNAPGTALYEYLVPNLSSAHIEDAYNQLVSDDVVDVVNSSFGGCEQQGVKFDRMSEKIAMQGEALGITFDAGSGDYGSKECSPKGVSSPASNPHFTSVGGTVLTVDDTTGAYIGETAWSGSGGGVSVEWGEPSYQKLVSGPIAGSRNVPDLAFAASNVAVYDEGWAAVDGTSWAAPTYAALQTEIDEYANARAGEANVAWYTLASESGASSYFHDITTGCNGAYCAQPGYDNVTGIGSVQGESAAQAFP